MVKKVKGANLYISILLIMVTAIFSVGGKLMYDVVRDLVVEQKEVKKELMVISNYIAKTDVKTEYIEREIEELKNKLNVMGYVDPIDSVCWADGFNLNNPNIEFGDGSPIKSNPLWIEQLEEIKEKLDR